MTTWSYPALEVTVEGPLASFTLSDPDNLNAIRVATFAGLIAALDEIAKPRHGVRALLLNGEGRAFCAGLNLKEDRSQRPAAGLAQALVNPLMRRLRGLEIPVVAAVQGPCVGIGVALALTADFVLAADDAYFLLPYRNLGVSVDGGTTWLLPRLIGWARARRMLMLAERLPARTALDWGLIHDVVATERLAATTDTLCNTLANGPTLALGAMRQDFWRGWENDFDAHLEFEVASNAQPMRSQDARLARTGKNPTFRGN